jgi:hypothetical protein
MPGGWDEGSGGKQKRLMRPLGAGEARAVFLLPAMNYSVTFVFSGGRSEFKHIILEAWHLGLPACADPVEGLTRMERSR